MKNHDVAMRFVDAEPSQGRYRGEVHPFVQAILDSPLGGDVVLANAKRNLVVVDQAYPLDAGEWGTLWTIFSYGMPIAARIFRWDDRDTPLRFVMAGPRFWDYSMTTYRHQREIDSCLAYRIGIVDISIRDGRWTGANVYKPDYEDDALGPVLCIPQHYYDHVARYGEIREREADGSFDHSRPDHGGWGHSNPMWGEGNHYP